VQLLGKNLQAELYLMGAMLCFAPVRSAGGHMMASKGAAVPTDTPYLPQDRPATGSLLDDGNGCLSCQAAPLQRSSDLQVHGVSTPLHLGEYFEMLFSEKLHCSHQAGSMIS
jgi:hypothetical protein